MKPTLYLPLFLLATNLFGQVNNQKIEGKVVNKTTGEPVPYAAISIDRTTLGTSSNQDGFFVLVFPDEVNPFDRAIAVSSVGFETMRIDNPTDTITILLKPSTIELKEVVVYPSDYAARRIVSKALSRIKRNYETNTFVYKSFYRHYCKDDTTYGRLIEAAVEIYKRKGYKIVRPQPGYKEEVRVTQLRRSFDNTRLQMKGHQPIALYSVMGGDPVSYQTKTDPLNNFLSYFMYNVSGLKKNLRDFDFEFDGVTTYDGDDVFRIKYSRKFGIANGLPPNQKEQGTLFIGTNDYAILKSEYLNTRENRYKSDSILSTTIYKKIGKKYYHHYTVKEGKMLFSEDSTTHTFTLQLMTSDIVLKDYPTFKGKEPDKEKLLSIDYDSIFWDTYNIVKATPLQEKIASHLQQELGLQNQYTAFEKIERERYLSGQEDEEKFNKHLLAMRGTRPVYIFSWATWCEECVKDIPRLKRLIEMYKAKVSFVMISLDHDVEAWKQISKRYDLDQLPVKSFRIGRNADAIRSFSIGKLPLCILVDKAGNFVDLDAKAPDEFRLIKDFEDLLSQSDK